MPFKPCRFPSCSVLLPVGAGQPAYCDKHRRHGEESKRNPKRDRTRERERQGAHARGYDHRWRRASKSFLANNPFCVICAARPYPLSVIPVPATVVDHVKPHRGDKELFWDETNWQALCTPCHNRKTARESRDARIDAMELESCRTNGN